MKLKAFWHAVPKEIFKRCALERIAGGRLVWGLSFATAHRASLCFAANHDDARRGVPGRMAKSLREGIGMLHRFDCAGVFLSPSDCVEWNHAGLDGHSDREQRPDEGSPRRALECKVH